MQDYKVIYRDRKVFVFFSGELCKPDLLKKEEKKYIKTFIPLFVLIVLAVSSISTRNFSHFLIFFVLYIAIILAATRNVVPISRTSEIL